MNVGETYVANCDFSVDYYDNFGIKVKKGEQFEVVVKHNEGRKNDHLVTIKTSNGYYLLFKEYELIPLSTKQRRKEDA